MLPGYDDIWPTYYLLAHVNDIESKGQARRNEKRQRKVSVTKKLLYGVELRVTAWPAS